MEDEDIFEGSTAVKTNPKLWAQCKAEAKASMGGKHSARSMQKAVQLYKKRGGGYKGPKKSDNKLKQWGDQKWRTSDGSKSEGKKRYLPDKAWSKLSKKEIAATNRAKAQGNAEGKQFVNQPKKIAKKTKSSRMTESSETTSASIPVRNMPAAGEFPRRRKRKGRKLQETSESLLLAAFVEAGEEMLAERKLSDSENKFKKDHVKKLKKHKSNFTDRYGKDGESVMWGVATNLAKKKAK